MRRFAPLAPPPNACALAARVLVVRLLRIAGATLLIFGFIAHWNDSFSPLVFTRSESMKTVSVAMISLTNGANQPARMGAAAAAAFLMTAPTLIVFLLRQAKVIQTMAHSGIKS